MDGSGYSNQVKIFDLEKEEWRGEEPLSPEFLGRGGIGLTYHRAVEIPKEGGVWVVCLGGKVKGFSQYSSNLLLLDIFY